MANKYLDYNGLSYLWSKIKAYVVPQTRTVNGKALSSNITLSASDVSAASSTHTHGNIANTGSVAGSSAIQSGDALPVLEKTTKSLKGSNLAFGSSTTTYLRNDGTWGTPSGGGGGTSSLIISEGGTAQSIASGTTWTSLTSSTVSLPSAGIYILIGGAQYASNSSGRRALCWYNESTSARVTRSFHITAPANGAATYIQNTLILEATEASSYTLQVYQNSGSALNVTPYMQVVKLA